MPWHWSKTPQNRLWTPEGSDALAYLKGRGLTEATIKAARLGWTPRVIDSRKTDRGPGRRSGVVIPWWIATAWHWSRSASPRGASRSMPKRSATGPRLYPDPEAVRPGKPLVVREGEFDALLLGQALGDLAAVVTLGSASSRPEGSTIGRCWPPLVVSWPTDADTAGDKAASGWPPRAIRVRPPTRSRIGPRPINTAINLRRWWTDRLGGIEAPALSTWDELAARRWGPAIGDPTPGIVIDQPPAVQRGDR